jgi:hypothetical protein
LIVTLDFVRDHWKYANDPSIQGYLRACKVPTLSDIKPVSLPFKLDSSAALKSNRLFEKPGLSMASIHLPLSFSVSTVLTEDYCRTPAGSEMGEMNYAEKGSAVESGQDSRRDDFAYRGGGEWSSIPSVTIGGNTSTTNGVQSTKASYRRR